MANNAEQRKRTRKEIKRNASASHSGRTLALLALERLALAGLVQRTSVFVEDETLRYSTRRTRTHMPAVPLIDKAALICCVKYMRNSRSTNLMLGPLWAIRSQEKSFGYLCPQRPTSTR